MSSKLAFPIAIAAAVGVAIFAEMGTGGVGTNAGEGVLSRFIGNTTMVNSTDETLLGKRAFQADYQFGRLTVQGAAYTFTDLDAPETFVPYLFSFDGTAFGSVPALGRDALLADYTRQGGADVPLSLPAPTNCVTPTDTATTQICQITSPVADSRPAIIGVIQPDPATLPLQSGDDTCRAEVQGWMQLPEYADTTVALCVVMDLRFDAETDYDSFWMDVIMYQRLGSRLLNMRAERRNFEHI